MKKLSREICIIEALMELDEKRQLSFQMKNELKLCLKELQKEMEKKLDDERQK